MSFWDESHPVVARCAFCRWRSVCLIFMGLDKIEWLTDSGILLAGCRNGATWQGRWRGGTRDRSDSGRADLCATGRAGGAHRWIGTRAGNKSASGGDAGAAHGDQLIASDVMLRYDYLINAYGLPILGGLLALAVGGARLPFSVSK